VQLLPSVLGVKFLCNDPMMQVFRPINLLSHYHPFWEQSSISNGSFSHQYLYDLNDCLCVCCTIQCTRYGPLKEYLNTPRVSVDCLCSVFIPRLLILSAIACHHLHLFDMSRKPIKVVTAGNPATKGIIICDYEEDARGRRIKSKPYRKPTAPSSNTVHNTTVQHCDDPRFFELPAAPVDWEGIELDDVHYEYMGDASSSSARKVSYSIHIHCPSIS
jgi:hypothetical protein